MATPLSKWPVHRLAVWIAALQDNPGAALIVQTEDDSMKLKKFFPQVAKQIRHAAPGRPAHYFILDGDPIELPEFESVGLEFK